MKKLIILGILVLSFSVVGIVMAQIVNQPPTIVQSGVGFHCADPIKLDQGWVMVDLDGQVDDDDYPGNPVTTHWTPLTPGNFKFEDQNSPQTKLCIEGTGVFEFQLISEDGEFVTTDNVTVTVTR